MASRRPSPRRPRRSPRRLVVLAAVVAVWLVSAGCQVRVDLGFDVEDDGSGVVRVAVGLDEEASATVPDLAAQLRVDDLEATGWDVTGPVEEPDGFTWVRAAKPFATPADAGRVLEEVSGPEGPFQDFVVAADRGVLRDEVTLRGVVDLTSGLEGFSDEELRARLGGPLDEQLGGIGGRIDEALDQIFRFRVIARLPGEIDANAPTVTETAAVWSPRLGERVELAASSSSVRWATVAWLALAAAATLALVAVVVLRRRRAAATGAAAGTGGDQPSTDDVTPAR